MEFHVKETKLLRSGLSRLPLIRQNHISCPLLTTRRSFCRRFSRSNRQWMVRGQGGDEEETQRNKDVIDGYNIEEKTILESPLFANALYVGLFALFFGFAFLLYLLAKPLVDNTIDAFPGA